MAHIFNLLFYQPLYNGLVFLFDILPWADAGVVVILFTCIVKLALFPLSYKSVKTQLQMKKFEPDLALLREKHKDNKQEQALKVMEFYRENGINPFSSFFLILIQIPIIFALYYIFRKAGLPDIDTTLLYSFIKSPGPVSMDLLGVFNIAGKSIILALLAAVSSFFQLRLSIPPVAKNQNAEASFSNDLARVMNFQMRFIFPVIVFFISYSISGVVALYWFTSNIFTIAQELYVRKHLKDKEPNSHSKVVTK